MLSSISKSVPELGSTIRAAQGAQYITSATANRPYILGSGVFGINIKPITELPEAKVGGITADTADRLLGIMALGLGQIVHRGVFVTEGYNQRWNNLGISGGYYIALDLQYFDPTKLSGATLTADGNGVFSYSNTAVQSTGASTTATATLPVKGGVVVVNYCNKPILEAINRTIAVGSTNYIFNYPKGIGALEVFI